MPEEQVKEKPKQNFSSKEATKEITIKLNINHLKKGFYVLIILALVGVIIAQQYGTITTRNGAPESNNVEAVDEEESEVVGTIEEETAPVIEVIEQVVEPVVEVVENTTEVVEEKEVELTGEILFVIDNVKVEKKTDDYARIMSTTYTITNLDADFDPTIKGHMDGDTDDIKVIELAQIDAGKTFSKTDTKVTFGYNDIDTKKKLILELYNEKNKLIKTATYSFDTE